jgi:protein-tyrosine phosphatase
VAAHVTNLYPDRFTYLTLDLRDLPEFPILKVLPQAIEFIDETLEGNGCCLVHCNAGISRSATIVLAYLMKKKGMTLNQAFTFLRSKRPSSLPNPGFMIQLKTYEESLGIYSPTEGLSAVSSPS